MSHQSRSPLLAGFASSVFPGAGQLITGARAFGWMLVGSTAATVAYAVWGYVEAGREGLVDILTNPDLLLVLVSIDIVLGLLRILAVTDAWRRAGGHFLRLGLAGLVVFTILPHAALAYVGLETRSTIMHVFPEDAVPLGGPGAPLAMAATTSSTTSTTSTTTTTVAVSGPIVAPWTVPTSSTTTTTTLPLGAQRLSFLLLGGDAGPGRPGLRTDAVIVATVDTATGQAALFGLPRNTAGLAFSDGTEFPGMNRGILNEVYEYGRAHPDSFAGPDPGITAVADIVSTTLGLRLDYYILVDMAGFAEIVDAFGGVLVNPSRSFKAPLYDEDPADFEMITFDPGQQRLDGHHALAYARGRTNSNDYVRMERQRCLVTSLLSEGTTYRLMSKLVTILDVIKRRVSTNIPSSELPFLINFAPRIDTARVAFVGFGVDFRTGTYTETGYEKADIPLIQATVAEVLAGSWDESTLDVRASSDVCG